MTTTMQVSVVVPTYRRAAHLPRMVAALEAQTCPRHQFEVVIVDDASPDDTPAVVAGLVAASGLVIRGLRLDRNGGPAAARNAGWAATSSPLVAFVDDDCEPEPGWLASLVAAFDRNDRLGVVQGRTRGADGPRGPWTVTREVSHETPWFEGCNIAYRRAALETTGGFDADIRWYGEDTAAGWKVLEAGWERDFEGRAVVVHDLEERGVRWRIRHGWLETNLVQLAARHPGLGASAFWRPWAFRSQSVTLPLAVAGVVAAPWWLPSIVAAAPYLVSRRPLWRRPLDLLSFVAIDGACTAGHVHGSICGRTVVL